MEVLRHEHLRTLIKPIEGPCVSIYQPTSRSGTEVKQGPIRLKNQIREAERQLEQQNHRPQDIQKLLEPIQKLCDNNGFWQYQSDGLAIFRAPGTFFYYRLPLHFDELLVVTERFHVKPLLRLFAEDGRYYLLTLSKNQVRLLQCTRYGTRELSLPENTPRSLSQMTETEGVQRQLQVHTAGSTTHFHGHGSKGIDEKEELREFFRMVDRGVRETLGDERAPLILAGVEYFFPLYREGNTYGHLMEGGITGSPEGRRTEELQSNAWAIVEPYFRSARESAAQRYFDYSGTARTSDAIEPVLRAAFEGRVEQLFVAVGTQIWGQWNEEARTARQHERKQTGDRDLLNLAAIQTLLQGGSVFAVPPSEVPGGKLLAAIFRY